MTEPQNFPLTELENGLKGIEYSLDAAKDYSNGNKELEQCLDEAKGNLEQIRKCLDLYEKRATDNLNSFLKEKRSN